VAKRKEIGKGEETSGIFCENREKSVKERSYNNQSLAGRQSILACMKQQ